MTKTQQPTRCHDWILRHQDISPELLAWLHGLGPEATMAQAWELCGRPSLMTTMLLLERPPEWTQNAIIRWILAAAFIEAMMAYRCPSEVPSQIEALTRARDVAEGWIAGGVGALAAISAIRADAALVGGAHLYEVAGIIHAVQDLGQAADELEEAGARVGEAAIDVVGAEGYEAAAIGAAAIDAAMEADAVRDELRGRRYELRLALRMVEHYTAELADAVDLAVERVACDRPCVLSARDDADLLRAHITPDWTGEGATI
jgi:hypothetical protein